MVAVSNTIVGFVRSIPITDADSADADARDLVVILNVSPLAVSGSIRRQTGVIDPASGSRSSEEFRCYYPPVQRTVLGPAPGRGRAAMKVLVMGGGVIGVTTAWQLLKTATIPPDSQS